MQSRLYEFLVGVETSVQPDAGSPVADNDLVTKGYVTAGYVQVPVIVGSVGSPQAVTAVGGVNFTGTADEYLHIYFLQGSGGAVDISANPQISAGTAIGQRLVIRGCSDTNTIKLEHGAGLLMNGECFLGSGSMIEFLWTGSTWDEMSRSGI